jgi:hypothetical protein
MIIVALDCCGTTLKLAVATATSPKHCERSMVNGQMKGPWSMARSTGLVKSLVLVKSLERVKSIERVNSSKWSNPADSI